MTIQVVYPYNPHGANPESFIQGETHSLSSSDNTYRIIVPEAAPFFQKNLSIKHVLTNYTLVLGLDYVLDNGLSDYAAIAHYRLYSAIRIINKSLYGQFTIDYHTIGDNYASVPSKVLTHLVNVLTDPVVIDYDNLTGKPVVFPPKQHMQSWYDIINKDEIADSISSHSEIITDRGDGYTHAINAYVTYINDLIAELAEDINIASHSVDFNNPHGLMESSLTESLLSVGASATDAKHINGKTLFDFLEYMKDENILTKEIIDSFIKKYSYSIITKPLLVNTIKNDGEHLVTIEADESTGNIRISADKGFFIVSE